MRPIGYRKWSQTPFLVRQAVEQIANSVLHPSGLLNLRRPQEGSNFTNPIRFIIFLIIVFCTQMRAEMRWNPKLGTRREHILAWVINTNTYVSMSWHSKGSTWKTGEISKTSKILKLLSTGKDGNCHLSEFWNADKFWKGLSMIIVRCNRSFSNLAAWVCKVET